MKKLKMTMMALAIVGGVGMAFASNTNDSVEAQEAYLWDGNGYNIPSDPQTVMSLCPATQLPCGVIYQGPGQQNPTYFDKDE